MENGICQTENLQQCYALITTHSAAEGRNLMDKFVDLKAGENGNTPSPCEFTAFEGEFLGKNIKVKIIEPEDGTKLLGPAAWNNIYISDGNIVGVPEKDINDELSLKAVENGIPTGISYMDGVTAYASYKIEEMIVSGAPKLSIKNNIIQIIIRCKFKT